MTVAEATPHLPSTRLRRESYGELVQIDGSEHRWFEDRAASCTLLVFIDDPTSKLMQLRFAPSESTDSYFEALWGYLDAHGCPVAFYSAKHSVHTPRIYKQYLCVACAAFLGAERASQDSFASIESSSVTAEPMTRLRPSRFARYSASSAASSRT